MLVEDEPLIVELVTALLAAAGFQVTSCSKATQALRYMNNQKYDCLVLDNKLEQGSGEDLLANIRKDKKSLNHATPALLVSGHLDYDVLRRVGRNVSGALVKPFEHHVLISKVKELCGYLR